jgi:hypothetical protein
MISTKLKWREGVRQARRARVLRKAYRRAAREADLDRKSGVEPRYLALRDAPLPWARNNAPFEIEHARLPGPAP